MADASIIVDTKLDNKGFQSGSAQMRKAVDGLQSTFDDFGRKAEGSINAMAPALQNAAQKAQELSSSLSETEFQRSMDRMASACEKLDAKILSLRQRAEQGFTSEAQAQKWRSDLQSVQQEATNLQQQLSELGSRSVKANSLVEMEAEAEKLEQKLFSLYDKRDNMRDLGADTASKSWQSLEQQIANTEEALERVERGIAAKTDPGSVESEIGGAGYTQGAQSEAFQQLAGNVNQVTSALNTLSGTEASFSSSAKSTSTAMVSFGSVMSSVASTAMGFVKSAFTGLASALSTGLGMAVSGAKTLFSGLLSVMTSVGHTALSTASFLERLPFRAIASGVNVAKKALSSFSNKTKSTTLTSNGLVKSLMSVKRMLITRVKRMFISSIFNSVKSSLQNIAKVSSEFNTSMSNIKNAATTMGGNVAVTFSNLVNAVAPALTTIINWLSTAISYLNAFFAMLSGKTSVMVAKQSTDDYAKSLKNASGAAKDLNHQVYGFDELTKQEDSSSSGSSSGASYEEQEIGSLLPDSIKDLFNNIKEAIAAQEWEKVGALVADGLNSVVTSIDDWINNVFRPFGVEWAENIARILNGFVDEFDFAALGDLLADGLNAVLDIGYTFLTTFDWSRLGEQLANGANSLLNNIDWQLLGNFFAAKWNAVIDTASNFLKNFNWSAFGEDLNTAMSAFVNNIHWDELQEGITAGLNGIIDLISVFAEGSWIDDLATRLGSTIGGILNNVNWNELVSNVANGILRIRTAFWNIITEIDIPSLSMKLVEAVNGLFSSEDSLAAFTESNNAVASGVNSLIDAFWNIVDPENGIDFGGIAAKIGAGVGSLLSQVHWSTLVSGVFSGGLQLATAFGQFVTNLNLGNVTSQIAAGINGFFSPGSAGASAFTSAAASVASGVNSLIDAFWNIVDPEKGIDFEGIAAQIGAGVGKFLDDVNWTKLVLNILFGGVRLIAAFGQFVTNLHLENVAAKIAEGINSFFTADSEGNSPFTKAAQSASDGLNSIIKAFGTLFDPEKGINFESIRKTLTDGINTLLYDTDWDTLLATIGKGVTSAVTEFFKLVDGILNPGEGEESLGTKLSNGINGIFRKENGDIDETTFTDLGQSLGEAIKGIFNNINSFITETDWGKIGESIGNALGSIDWIGIAGSLIQLLWNGLIAAVDAVGGLVGAFIRKLFGIEDVEVFDVTGREWATQLAESVNAGAMEGTVQQQIATCAAAYATGMCDSFLGEMNTRQQEINTGVEHVANEIVRAIADVLEDPDELYEAASVLQSALKISQEDAVAILTNSELNNLTFEDIMSGLYNAENGEEVIAFFESIGLKCPQGLANQLSEAEPLVADAAKSLISNLQNATTLEEAKAYFAQAGIDVGDAFAASIAGESTENIAAALMLLGAGVDEATILAMDTSHLSENLSAYMEASGEDLTTIATELGAQVGDGIGFTIPDAIAKALGIGTAEVERVKGEMIEKASATTDEIDSAKDKGDQLGSGSAESVTSGIEDETGNVETAASGVVNAVSDTLEDGKDGITEKAEDTATGIEDAYKDLPDNVKPYAETLMAAVTQAIIDGDPVAVAAIEAAAQAVVNKAAEIMSKSAGEEIAKAFVDGWNNGIVYNYSVVNVNAGEVAAEIRDTAGEALSQSNGSDIGEAFVTGIDDGIANNYSGAVTDAGTVGSDIISAAQDYVNESNGQTIGENMLIGMINGFYNYGQMLVNVMAEICKCCVDTAREILGIASPSKVFERIGSYVMEGMNIGLEDTGEDAIGIVGDIADAMVKEAQDGNGIAIRIDAMTDGLDDVSDKLTRIADIFIGITDSLAEMGGLQLPSIANGQVIPYAAQAAGNATGSPENGISKADMKDAFKEALFESRDSNNDPIVIQLLVDGRNMADVVTKYQRQQARAWG